jgi:hypothetical protein
MPAQAEQINGDDVLYLLVDENDQLLQAVGTAEYFWIHWAEVIFRMTPNSVIVESRGAVIVVDKLPLHSIGITSS